MARTIFHDNDDTDLLCEGIQRINQILVKFFARDYVMSDFGKALGGLNVADMDLTTGQGAQEVGIR